MAANRNFAEVSDILREFVSLVIHVEEIFLVYFWKSEWDGEVAALCNLCLLRIMWLRLVLASHRS